MQAARDDEVLADESMWTCKACKHVIAPGGRPHVYGLWTCCFVHLKAAYAAHWKTAAPPSAAAAVTDLKAARAAERAALRRLRKIDADINAVSVAAAAAPTLPAAAAARR